MIFLLYHNEKLLQGYGNAEILRLSLLILIYRLHISEKINKINYKNLEKLLTNNPFSIENFEDYQLKTELDDIAIKIEVVDFVNDEQVILNKILDKIKFRFDELEEILAKDVRVKATFPGENSFKHRLGTMYKEDWKLISLNNYDKLASKMHQFITEKISNLLEIFGKDRIIFADVDYQNANSLNYQVWSANAINYNLPKGTKIPGDYQALEMKKQDDGVFGIITTPRYGY